jgi:hypothetical protein
MIDYIIHLAKARVLPSWVHSVGAKRSAGLACIAGLFFCLFPTPDARADQNPPGCTGSGLGIFLYTDSPDVHIGDTLNYSITVFNGANVGPIVCNASSIMAFVVTPDGISHPITLVHTNMVNGQSDYYPSVVSYVVRAQDILPDGTVNATATDMGVIHQNNVNSEGGGNQGVNTMVSQPCIQIAAQCAGSIGENGLITFTGTVTNCGNDTLTGVTITNFINGGQFPVAFITNLLAGQTAAFGGSFVPLNPCGAATTTLIVQGVDSYTSYPKTVTSTANTTCSEILTPGIVVTKTCPASPVASGQLLTFSGSVSNSGNVTLNGIVVLNNQPAPNTPIFTLGSLAPGVVTNFTGSYLAPTNCSVTDTLTATATSRCGAFVTNTASATCAVQPPMAVVVTETCPSTPVYPGGLLTYSGSVSNAGGLTLTNIVVVSDRPATNTTVLLVATLAPGATTNFTGSYQVPLNCCVVVNTLQASGQGCGGLIVTDSDTHTCTVSTAPQLVVTKTCTSGLLQPGSLLTYSGSVSNAGNITLVDVTVADSEAPGNPPLATPIVLAPGQTANFTGSYLVPPDFCGNDTVTASGLDVCNNLAVSNSVATTCPITTSPRITLTKNCPLLPTQRGGLYTYTGTVGNAGNVSLVNVYVVDDEPTNNTPVIGPLTLAPGMSVNFTNSYVAPVCCCLIIDTLTASGQDHCTGSNVSDTATAVCPLLTIPSLALLQTCPPDPIPMGSLYAFSGYVTNTSEVVLTNVLVFGPLGTNNILLGPISLAPGEAEPYLGSYNVPFNICSVTVTAVGQETCGGTAATNSTSCPVATTPQLVLTQNCPLTPAIPGSLLTYSGSVSNAGNITLTRVVVLNNQSGVTPIFTTSLLAPGATANFTGSYLAPANCFSLSTSTAIGLSLCGVSVTNTVSTTCPINTTPQIKLTQNCPLNPAIPGGLLTYSGSVSNSGNILLTNIVVLNNLSGLTPIFTAALLPPGAVTNFTGSYLAPTNCSSTSFSTVIGQSLCGGAVSNTVSTTCPIIITPLISITQNCPLNPTVPGGLLTYSGSVSNSGNILLTNIVVLNNLSGLTPIFTASLLPPGAVTNFSGSYLAPTNCSSTSISTVIGQSLCGGAVSNTASTTCPIILTPLINITQNCPLNPVIPGGLLTYSGSVSNAGNIAFTNIVVLNNLSGLTPIFTTSLLPPGAVTNFTGSYLAPTNCSSTSISTAIGLGICGAATNTVLSTCPITATPLISITQNCPVNPVIPGGLLTYSGSVSNAGNITFTNIVVLNNLSGLTPIFTASLLPPGAVTNFTGSYLAPTNCSSTSISTAIGLASCGAATNTVISTCPITAIPLISITQNCPLNPVIPGGLLTYSGSVSNAGNVTFTNIVVLNNLSGLTPIFTASLLPPGAVTNFTGSYLAPTNCSSTSISTAIGLASCGAATNTVISTCPITAIPLISITQNCPVNPVIPGGLLTYSGSVSNAGNIAFTNIVVLNNLSGLTPIFTASLLAPGAVTNFTGSYLAPTNCSSTSISTAIGLGICGAATNTVLSTCPITTLPLISITQNCPVNPVLPGGLLTYSGSVSNAGNITLTNVVVLNNLSGLTPILTAASLAPGAVTNFTGSYLALSNCASTSISTATGLSVCGGAATNTTITTCAITTTPAIAITETCPPGPASAGTVVTYGGLVSNNGNITLTNVLVYSSDPTNHTLVLGPILLAPGTSAPFTGTYVATSGSNPMTNSTIVTNNVASVTTNVVSIITTNNLTTFTTNSVAPTFGTIDPVSGALIDRFLVPNNLKGLMYADQDENWGPTLFYATRTPVTGPDEFDTISTVAPNAGTVTDRITLSSTNYDALTLAAPDVGYGAVNFYYARHNGIAAPIFGEIIAQGASTSGDLWPLAGSGYAGLTFAAPDLGYGANLFYDVCNGTNGLTTFGTINPTPGGIETTLYNVGTNFDSLVFVPGAVSTWGTAIFAYLRHTSTGSVIGTIDPVTKVVTDRLSLGTNLLSDLTFAATDVGYGANLFYYIRPAATLLTTNLVTTFSTNTVITLITNSLSTYVTNTLVTFTPTNSVMAIGMDICQDRTVVAAANCLGPVALLLIEPVAPLISAPSLTAGSFNLSIPTESGKSYTVQYKSKLTDLIWTNLQTVTGTGGQLILTNPASPGQPSRFYRIMSTP